MNTIPAPITRASSFALLGSALLITSCATTIETSVTVPGGKGDLGMERISIYPVKDSQNRGENAVATAELESMFVNAEVKGKSVFDVMAMNELGDIQEQQRIERQALRGSFDQSTVTALRSKGVQGLVFTVLEETASSENTQIETDNGIKRCTTRSVVATFYPKIVRAADAQIAVQDSYSGTASQTACAGIPPFGPIAVLAQEARDDALADLRKDIAPYSRSMDATVLTNFCTGGMRDRVGGIIDGGPCDDSAPSDDVIELVEGGEKFAKQGRLDRACEQWSTAANSHSEGFIMPYLLGVCAELASDDIAAATAFYQQADGQTTQPVKVIGEALDRMELKAGATSIQARSTPKPVRKPNPEVLAAQEALVDLGYEPGSADGFIGAQTQKALQFFQEDMGLDVTGIVDAPTKQELGISTMIAN